MLCGAPTGNLRIGVKDEEIGWFTIDDNENLWDKNLPRFTLEYRNENVPPEQFRLLHNDGWTEVTTKELLDVLESAGVINRE